MKYKINQIKLAGAICKNMCDQQAPCVVPAEQEFMVVCIEAANLVVERLKDKEYQPIETKG
ncbi:MAG: hypothetical protein ACI9T9_001274 [Oleiphilaceae bacterium]|jgi:hypothetical protein